MVTRHQRIKYRPLALRRPRKKLQTFVILGVVLSLLCLSATSLAIIHADKTSQEVLGAINNAEAITNPQVKESGIKTPASKTSQSATLGQTNTPTITPTKTPTPKHTHSVGSGQAKTPLPTNKPTSTPTPASSKQYTAEKVGETTYKINHTSSDSEMASAWQIYEALNKYRDSNGRSSLSWDNNLASLAEERARTFSSNGGLDSHAGFRSYMDNDGFSKVGFNGLGENSAQLAGNMAADRIINEIFGADADHDGNQLDPSWTHIGIGVNGLYINVNFGKGKK